MPEVVEIDPITGPGAEGARRATGGPGPVTGSRASDPDPEVPAKVERRRFPPAYRLRILKEVDACKRPGEVGALLGDVPCAVETERRLGSRLRNHFRRLAEPELRVARSERRHQLRHVLAAVHAPKALGGFQHPGRDPA